MDHADVRRQREVRRQRRMQRVGELRLVGHLEFRGKLANLRQCRLRRFKPGASEAAAA